jgi:pimeloyl-ACP methyl ester carboxylesterase
VIEERDLGAGLRSFAHREPRRRGIVLHAYGGDGAEVALLARSLAGRLRARVLVPDLPGHGAQAGVPLTMASSRAALALFRSELGPFDFAVGHSLGARLALELEAPLRVLAAMPGEPRFGGSRRELVQTLRPGRVREAAPLEGLVEVLGNPLAIPLEPTLLITAARDLETVLELARVWEARGVERTVVSATTHRDLIGSAVAIEAAAAWLEARLA